MGRLYGDFADLAEAKNIAVEALAIANEALAAATPLSYSTTEQDSGQTWHDGKVIYYKVVTSTGNQSTGTTNYAHGISSFDRFTQYWGVSKRSNGAQLILPFNSSTSTFVVSMQVDATNIIVNVGTSYTGAGNVLSDPQFVLFYTKP